MKSLKSKISRKLILYIVLFSSLVTLVLTAIQLRIDYNHGINGIHQRIDQIKKTNMDSIKQSLWTLDQSSINIQLDGLGRISDIIYVEINDADNNLVSSAGEMNTKDTIIEHIYIKQYYRDQDILLGTLTVVATKENVYQQLIDTAIIILVSQAIKTFLVSMFVLIIFYYLVTRHLNKIARHSDMLDITSRPPLLELDRKSSGWFKNDELDHVVTSINKMSQNVYNAYLKLVESNNTVADQKAKLNAIFNSITDAIVFADVNRRILQTNAAFTEIFGYSEEEVLGKTTLELYASPEEYKKQGEIRYNANAKKVSSVYEVTYQRKDGSTFIGETMGSKVALPDGTQVGLVGIIRDISSRKQSEGERVLLQKQLQQSQKMEAIGQLTGGIAHDFNNILSSILGYSELSKTLLDNSSDRQLIKYNKRINDGAERARDLVAQLSAFSRSAPSDPGAIKLPELIAEVRALIQPTIPSGIDVITEIENNVPSVYMDYSQMHQVLMNLCINARDAMQNHGKLTIRLSHEHSVDGICNACHERVIGEYVKLSVEDTGSGIDEEILEHIFEPFITTKERGKGTGMGLSVIHGILHKHRSHVVVVTERGFGSRFHILIPPFVDDKGEPEVSPATVKLKHDGKNKHVLVVDDEESITAFLEEYLEMFNYKVTVSNSPKQAISFFKHADFDFDLVITDQTMPEMIGTEMIKRIHKIAPDVPCILCSGYSEHVGEKEALEFGFSKYLNKPVDNHELLQIMHDILQGNRGS